MGKNKENDIFSSKFQVYFSFFSVIFLLFICIPLIFVSNEDPRVTGMAYPDTGELVLNLLTLISDQFFYDQTIPGKSALYGWAHTSLIFWQYAFIQWIGIDKNEFYSIYAFVARLNGVIISCLVAFLFPKVLFHFIKRSWIIGVSTLSLILSPLYITFSYQVKPDLLGMLFSFCSFFALIRFSKQLKRKDVMLIFFFSLLASACKQYYFILIIMNIFFYFYITLSSNNNYLKSNIYKDIFFSVLLCLFTAFLIHPYSFIKFPTFFQRQLWLKNSGFSEASIWIGIISWMKTFFIRDLVLLLGIIVSIFFIFYKIFNLFSSDKTIKFISNKTREPILIFLSVYCILHLLFVFFTIKRPDLQNTHYLLPIIPYFLLLIGVLADRVLTSIKNKAYNFSISILFLFLSIYILSGRVPGALWMALHDANIYNTNGYLARDYLKKYDWKKLGVTKDTKFIYSVAVAMPSGISNNIINDFAWDINRVANHFKHIREWGPEVMIIDHDRWYSDTDQFINIAKKLGLVLKFEIPYYVSPDYHGSCDPLHLPGSPLEIVKCAKNEVYQILGKAFLIERSGIMVSVYGKP